MSTNPSMPSLELKHYVWIFDAALEHFAAEINKYELEILQHERFPTDKLASHYSTAYNKPRYARIETLQEFLIQYREIMAWLHAVKEKLVDMNAEETAKAFAELLRRRNSTEV